MSKIIGCDLGSTLSECAVIENGKPVVIVNEEGSTTTPSVVSLKEGDKKVGASAKRQQVVNPKETINLIKRFMGASYEEGKKMSSHVQYDIVNNNGRAAVSVNGKIYSPEEISAMILQKMKKIAEDYLGTDVKDAVITVPAYFNDAQRQATKNAGKIAGLNVLRVIAEPTAAILSSNIDMKKGGKFMVVDYGGSTLDFSIADIGDNVVEILASNGDTFCGGSDLDKLVADYIVKDFKEKNGIDLSNDAMAMSRIIEAAEKAKVELSNSTSTDINLPYITAKDGNPIHLTMNLNRATFERIIDSELNKVIKYGEESLKKANITKDDLDGILLIGGSCRIPKLQEMLKSTFGDKLIKSSNLDLAVAEGAAIQGSRIEGDTSTGDIVLLDVTPLTLGIEVEGGMVAPLIEANTTIPCTKEQTFTNAADSQTAITVKVVQGERPMAKDNKQLGIFNLEGLVPAPRGTMKISVIFDIDANGILNVSAKDETTGKEQSIRIEASSGLNEEEIKRMRAEAKANEEADKKVKEQAEALNKAQATVYQNEHMINEFKDKLSEDEKKKIQDKIDILKSAIKDNKSENFEKLEKDVTDSWQEFSSRIYGQQNASEQSTTENKDDKNSGDTIDVDAEEVKN